MPKVCPVCGAPTIREDGEAVTRCTGIECSAKALRNIVHFASKEGMEIDGLGYSIIEQLLDKKLINNIADIYSLKLEDVASLKKNGKKFAQNLIDAIEKSKSNDLFKLINKDVDNMERSSNSKKLNIDVKAVEYILLLFFMPVYYFFS